MAHFVRVRSPGTWLSLSTLLPAEMESFDAQLYSSINGDGGGVWAPSAIIEIGGLGIKITGACVVTSLAELEGGADITGNLSVSGSSNLHNTTVTGSCSVSGNIHTDADLSVADDASITGDLTAGTLAVGGALFSGKTFSVTGNAHVSGTFISVGAFFASANASVSGDLSVEGNATLQGTLSVDGTVSFLDAVSLAQPLTPSGSGRVRVKAVEGADADTTYTIADAECVVVLSGSITANRIYTLGTTGAATGDRITFVSRNSANQISVGVSGNASENGLLKKDATGYYNFLEYTFVSGKWYLTASFLNP